MSSYRDTKPKTHEEVVKEKTVGTGAKKNLTSRKKSVGTGAKKKALE